jgi:NitT/TauT family transport system substrate-binding protein
MVRNPKAAAEALQQRYQRASIAEALKAQKMFSSREWRRLYSDGTVVKWLQQASDFFVTDAGVTTATPATEYFDSSLYLATVN